MIYLQPTSSQIHQYPIQGKKKNCFNLGSHNPKDLKGKENNYWKQGSSPFQKTLNVLCINLLTFLNICNSLFSKSLIGSPRQESSSFNQFVIVSNSITRCSAQQHFNSIKNKDFLSYFSTMKEDYETTCYKQLVSSNLNFCL